MPRPRYTVPRAEWKLHLPLDLAAEVELLLLDPLREKPKYGARNALVERLLREWLASRRRGDKVIAPLSPEQLAVLHQLKVPARLLGDGTVEFPRHYAELFGIKEHK